jgi:hypothetical protein
MDEIFNLFFGLFRNSWSCWFGVFIIFILFIIFFVFIVLLVIFATLLACLYDLFLNLFDRLIIQVKIEQFLMKIFLFIRIVECIFLDNC